jgi:hypothetical protein
VTISANGGAETATFTLNVTGDGIDGSDETSVIAGDDGNFDGVEDSNQLNVAAIPLTGGQYAILELNDGFTFRNVAQSDTPPATPPNHCLAILTDSSLAQSTI